MNENDQCNVDPQFNPYTCIKITGTPAVFGQFPVVFHSNSKNANGVESDFTFSAFLSILSSDKSNSLFTFSPGFGCENEAIQFSINNPINYTPIQNLTTGIKHQWVFDNGNSSLEENPIAQNYSTPGNYIVEYTQTIDIIGFRLKKVTLNSVACSDAIGYGNPDVYIEIIDGSNNIVHSTVSNPNDANMPQDYLMNLLLDNPPYVIRVMDNDDGNIIGTAHDNCIDDEEHDGTTPFPLPDVNSFGTINMTGSNGGLNFSYIIEKVVEINTITDTLIVYSKPGIPVLSTNSGTPVSISTPDLGYVYNWEKDGSNYYLGRGTTIFPNASGSYTVIAVNSHGCYSTSLPESVGISAIDEKEQSIVMIYPNPTNGLIYFETNQPGSFLQINISDLSGRILLEQKIQPEIQKQVIDISSLAKGIYTLILQEKSGKKRGEKIVIQ